MEKEIVISRFGSPEVLELQEKKVKEPKDDEVAIKVKACGVNFADIVMRIGLYKDAPPKPFSPGYEVAGIVAKVGKNVKNFKEGDKVIGATYFGGYSTYVCTQEDKVKHLPENMTFEEGAGIPVNYLTAYISLVEMSRIRKGDHVLIHGAAGGVGIASVQIAKEYGAVIYGTAGSKEKLEFLKSIGVDFPLSYKEEDFTALVKKVTGKDRALDIILDPVGGENIEKNLKLLKPTGRTVVFGASSMITGEKMNLLNAAKTFLAMRKIDTIKLIDSNNGVFGLNALKMWDNPIMTEAMSVIMDKFSQGLYKVNISDKFSLADASSAHRYIQDRKNIGKVILTT